MLATSAISNRSSETTKKIKNNHISSTIRTSGLRQSLDTRSRSLSETAAFRSLSNGFVRKRRWKRLGSFRRPKSRPTGITKRCRRLRETKKTSTTDSTIPTTQVVEEITGMTTRLRLHRLRPCRSRSLSRNRSPSCCRSRSRLVDPRSLHRRRQRKILSEIRLEIQGTSHT